MKRIFICKQLAILVLALGVSAGCASTAKEPEAAGPSAEATQAIDGAKASVAQAKAVDWVWRDTEEFLAQAEAAAAEGDNATAIKLANKARDEANLALNQYYLEKSKFLFAAASTAKGLSADQKKTLAAADEAIGNAEGRKAYDLLTPLVATRR